MVATGYRAVLAVDKYTFWQGWRHRCCAEWKLHFPPTRQSSAVQQNSHRRRAGLGDGDGLCDTRGEKEPSEHGHQRTTHWSLRNDPRREQHNAQRVGVPSRGGRFSVVSAVASRLGDYFVTFPICGRKPAAPRTATKAGAVGGGSTARKSVAPRSSSAGARRGSRAPTPRSPLYTTFFARTAYRAARKVRFRSMFPPGVGCAK